MIIDYPKIFAGKTVTIVGGGPSLKGFHFKQLKGDVIGINHSAFIVPNCTAMVFVDAWFYSMFPDEVKAFTGPIFTDRNNQHDKSIMIRYAGSDTDVAIQKINLSGALAIGVAIELGAKKLYLLGFDGGYKGDAHYHDMRSNAGQDNVYRQRSAWFREFAEYEIYNVGDGNSSIEAFKKIPFTDLYKY